MTESRDHTASPSSEADRARVVGGRYRLGPVIGRGGMATIHRATDLRVEREVAVKLLRPEVSRDPDLAQRFRREALAATVLRHPNIVACLDTGTDGGQPYLVMELVDGEDLAARLRRGGRLAPAQVARIGLDVARGLSVAHVRGIVHRDIKPGNILLAADGRAMVADFGIARLAVDAEAALPGTTLGSVHYFSPEQARGATTTPASDVYGLGLVMYEALTGSRAWTGETTDAIALARIGAAPPSPSARTTGIPPALEAVVVRALAPEPDDRFANGGAIAAALEPIVAELGPAATERVWRPAASALVPAGSDPPDRPVAPPHAPMHPAAPARRTVGPGLALVALAIAGVLGGTVLVAALPGSASELAAGNGAARTSSPRATDAPASTPQPSTTPTTTASPAPTPTPAATETPRPPRRGTADDLCESFFGLPCGLDAGRYEPSRFEPAFDIRIGDGWSNALHQGDLVTLTRDEGSMTFASELTRVDPDGRATTPRDKARSIIEAFVVTEGISSTRPAKVRIDGSKGFSVDVAPVDHGRVTIFTTATSTFALEPDRMTRLVVLDVHGHAVVIVIEPSERTDLEGILATADDAAATIRWR